MIVSKLFCNHAAPVLVLFSLTALAVANPEKQRLLTLNEAVGPVIDADENASYLLFSQNIGLISASVYQISASSWRLHLIGDKDGRPWMVVQKLGDVGLRKLKKRILRVEKNRAESVERAQTHVVRQIDLDAEFNFEQPVRITLVDDSELYGHISACTPDGIGFVTIGGSEVKIGEGQVLEIRWPKGQFSNGEFVRYDPNHIRLFFGATGRTMKKGEGNLSNFYVFFPTVAFGLTDHFMIGGGMSLLPGAPKQLVYFSPKIRFVHRESFDMAAGYLYLGVPGEGHVNAAYTSLSVGNPLGGVTVGVALPFGAGGELGEFVSILFGAEKQLSSSVKIMTENWYLTDNDGESLLLLSGGFRFIGDRLTVGLGFFTSPEALESEAFPIFPWLDFSLSFGK
ncbi:MAG: hypothetical protein ACE5IY_16265 [bacterium]